MIVVFFLICRSMSHFKILCEIAANSITAGQLLCGGLFNVDPLSNWFSAVALLHAIVENPTQKEQLLRVQLATSLGNPPVSLLQQCCNMLAQVHRKVDSKGVKGLRGGKFRAKSSKNTFSNEMKFFVHFLLLKQLLW